MSSACQMGWITALGWLAGAVLFIALPAEAEVDPSTLEGKVLCGYQGWFAAEGDGAELGWFHYSDRRRPPTPGHCTFDLWPDMGELDDDEKYPTAFRHQDGRVAYLFSSYNRKTVVRHFRWMREYGIDGVFLQRFGASLRRERLRRHRDVVLENVRAGAAQHGRVWALMYDLSGLRAGEIRQHVIEDWKRLRDQQRLTADPGYLHHRGRPLVGVWGVGFDDDRDYGLDECLALVEFLQDDPHYGGQAVLLGVPAWWRTLSRDAVADTLLHRVIERADIVSPWTVGRYDSPEAVRAFAENQVAPDLDWCRQRNVDYLPVVFPGFSWHNLMKTRGQQAPLDQIPRLGGAFLWAQYAAFAEVGATMIYQAMFDEIDEGTAIFKCTNDPPSGASPFLTYEGLPSDHYLWLAGQGGRLLRGELPLGEELPARDAEDVR